MSKEKVLVVPTSRLWGRVTHTNKGLITGGIDDLTHLVDQCGEFVERETAENDPTAKQIIPYAVVRHGNSVFLLQRKIAQGEQRLHNKLSIGVGGHINPSEAVSGGGDLIPSGLMRELDEELYVKPGYRQHFIGLINDDTTEVGSVHLGVLFEINSASFDVSVRENTKMEGDWVPVERLTDQYYRLETWSQIVYDSYLCLQNSA